MDNLTHTIVGLGVGELLHRSLPAESAPQRQRTRHRLLLTACGVASNLPDIDLLLTGLLPSPLGYLLNHRGHTHTVLFAIPEALLLAALLWLCWPAARALLRESRPARLGLALATTCGLALHLLMDYCNSYGLHPLAPFDTRWFYGDVLFIVEPLFWVALGVPLALTLRRPLAKLGWLALLGAALLFFALKTLLAWPALIALLLIGAACGALQRRAGAAGRAGLLLGLLVSLAFVGAQGTMSGLGRERIAAALQQLDPASRVLDVSMTAFPSEPLCWSFVTVESNEAAGSYRLRRGIFSIAPALVAPGACPAGLAGAEPQQSLTPALAQQASETASLARLRRLNADNCYVAAWLRFARDPALGEDTLSDARFANAGGRGNFSTLPLSASAARACPKNVPDWGRPRADLLTPAR
jgi:inner membrane protein